jgi:short-subunit dehydrogenase
MRRFVRDGWKVVTISLPGESFQPMPKNSVLTLSGDLVNEDVRQSLVEETLKRFGRIDVLVNNAGVGLYAPPSNVEIDLMRRMFEVNLVAPLRLAQLVVPSMRKQGFGTIVNISSVAGAVALPWTAGYCASKFALHSVTDSLRRELRGEGIRVVKVCPGIVDTAFRRNVLAGAPPSGVSDLKRVVSAGEVAEAVFAGVKSKSTNTIYVPKIGRVFTAMQNLSPWLMDWYLDWLSKPGDRGPAPVFSMAASQAEPGDSA